MKRGCALWTAAVVVLLCLQTPPFLRAETSREYALEDLYRIARERSEDIRISRYDVTIAEQVREKALSGLRPSLNAFGGHTRYSEEKTIAGQNLQPLWTGDWGFRLNQSLTLNGREWKAVRLAEENIDMRRFDLERVEADYLFAVAAAYYEVLKGIKAVEIAGANLRRLEAHLASVSARLELEDVAVTALYRAEAELSQSRAEHILSQNRLKLSRAKLATITGLTQIERIRDPGLREDLTFSGDLAALKQVSLEHRPELKRLEVQKQMAQKQIEIAKSAYWPVVSAEGLYYGQNQHPDSDYTVDNSLSLGLTLSFPLFDGGMRRADVSEALAVRQQSQLAIDALSKSIAIEVEHVFLTLKTHQSVLQSLQDERRSARENFNAVTRQFEYGLATSVDVMDANTVLVTSEKRLTESRYDFQLALLEMERATGMFLENVTAALKGGTDESP